MAFHHSPKIVTSGLVLALDAANTKSYPGSGTTWTDLSGNGNNGTLINGPTFDSGNLGSIEFDGVNDEVRLNGVGVSSWNDPFTMEVWMYVPTGASWDGGTNRLSTIFAVVGSYSGMYGLVKWPTEGQAGFYVRGDNGGISSTITGLARDTWHNLVGVWTGTVAYLYYNGSLTSGPNGSVRTGVPDTVNLTLGLARAFSGSTGAYFEGRMAVARYFFKALTPDEIQQNYNATKGRYGL
jgi:hypothetical protein